MDREENRFKCDIAKISTCCNLCEADDFELVTVGREHEYDNTTNDEFNVVRCRKCDFVYLNPRPDISELATIYPPNYYSYNQKQLRDEANPRSILHRLRYKGFEAKITQSLSLCNSENGLPLRILDIGCGDGHTLDLYARKPDVQTHGVDFNLQALEIARANGHTVYPGSFETAQLPEKFFDLVTATHVIEHVSDPGLFLKKVANVLKPGGVLWLETPNIGSIDALWFRQKHWGAYHFPRHWFFFTKETLTKFGAIAGFARIFVVFLPNAIFWFWTCHSILIEKFPRSRKWIDKLFPPIDFQRDSLANFVRICFFCGIDVVLKLCTKETSNMIMAFRRQSE